MKKISKLILLLLLPLTFISCDKDGYKELKGEWIWEDVNEEVKEGKSVEHIVLYYQLNFKEDKMNNTLHYNVDGKDVFVASCDADWNYETGVLDTNVEGVLILNYYLDTFKVLLCEKGYGELETAFRDQLKDISEASGKKEGIFTDDLSGYQVTDLSDSKVVFTTPEGPMEWIRPSAFKKP